MPKELEDELKRKARKLGLKPGTDRWNAYVYGGLRKTGWKPKRERGKHGKQ